jgi:hypothetical protein
MKKEEILMKYLNVDQSRTNEILLRECIHRAMDEYGRQCFEAGKDSTYDSFTPIGKPETYEDYIKELGDK